MKGWLRRFPLFRLLLLTLAALVVNGYHLGAEDAAVYLPVVKHAANPNLYPFGEVLFLSHARLSGFVPLVAFSIRLSPVSADTTIFAWHVVALFLLIAAAWLLSGCCFARDSSRWCAVCTLASVLSVPAAASSLLLMDPYLTARSFSTPLSLIVLASALERRNLATAASLVVTFFIHPLMAAYCLFLVGLLHLLPHLEARFTTATPEAVAAGAVPSGFALGQARQPYREALFSRDYFWITHWTWYEWFGVFAPLAILSWLANRPLPGTLPGLRRLSAALVPFGLVSTAAALALAVLPQLQMFLRLQPMRSFQLIYLVFFLLLGGVIGELLLKNSLWRWLVFFAPLSVGMWFASDQIYAASEHLEFPGAHSSNPWVQAFVWVRANTPKNAVFALDPDYMALPGEDHHGFGAISERSVLTDASKDGGVVSQFPQLAGEWHREQQAQAGWNHFQLADFERLAREYPVSWVVLHGSAPAGLPCPYANSAVSVCRIPGAPGLPQ